MCVQVHIHGEHPGLVSPPLGPLPSLCLHKIYHDLQAKLSTECATTLNELVMNDAHAIKNYQHLHI
jgi:hypothetical protein